MDMPLAAMGAAWPPCWSSRSLSLLGPPRPRGKAPTAPPLPGFATQLTASHPPSAPPQSAAGVTAPLDLPFAFTCSDH